MDIQSILVSIFESSSQLDVLYKEFYGDILSNYSYTEMHCIDCIGKIENPNVTKIAQTMNLTKAGISKCIKKLILKKALKTYKNKDNKKEIYYKLTTIGYEVFKKHSKMHQMWCSKDSAFFEKFDEKDIKAASKILNEYEKLLKSRLKEIKEDLK